MKIRKLLPIIGIGIFVYLLIKLDISRIFKEIANARLDFLFVAVSFVFISAITQTLKWFAIARRQKINVPFLEALKINLIADFYGFVTPSKLGSVIRADYLKKYTKGKIEKGVGNFILDKVIDIYSLVFLLIIFSFMFREFMAVNLIYYSILIILFLSAGLFIFMNKKRSKAMLRIVYRKLIPMKLKEKAKKSFETFYEDIPKKRHLFLFFLLNIINWVVIYAMTFFIGRAVGIELSFFYFLTILPIGTLVAQIPITINGLGTREATLISLFGFLGISAAKVFSMSVLALLIAGIIPSLVGWLLSLKEKA